MVKLITLILGIFLIYTEHSGLREKKWIQLKDVFNLLLYDKPPNLGKRREASL